MLSACGVWSWLFELFLGSSLSCYFGTGTSLAVLQLDRMEFLEPNCSVLGLCRSLASVASIKHGFCEPWPEAATGPAPLPRPWRGSRTCRS